MVGAPEGPSEEPLIMATRVMLTGAGGQLGTDVRLAAPDFPGLDLIGRTRDELDVTDAGAVVADVEAVAPHVIIHAGAWTAVDACEGDPGRAELVNGQGTANVVAAAREVGARVMYVSTDYVFDGTKPDAYIESDRPNPASAYGRSKLLGEQAMGADDVIVRTSWVCGAHGSNMVKTILRLTDSHETLTFVDDQIGKPSFTADLAPALLGLVDVDVAGVLHVTNEGVVSWYEFCREVLAAAGLDPDRVRPCATSELDPPRPAPRPANSVLANTRFASLGLPLLRDFREPLAEAVALLRSAS